MIKIITWINFAAFILGVAGLGGAFVFRSKIFDAVLDGVKKELPSLVEGSMPSIPKMPSSTGPVNPFKR
tara:strand:+ start:5534 stop:5740 length:207 start_codon:yes stop_codon:yes gene_type:complete